MIVSWEYQGVLQQFDIPDDSPVGLALLKYRMGLLVVRPDVEPGAVATATLLKQMFESPESESLVDTVFVNVPAEEA